MLFKKPQYDEKELEYMNEVDAALHRRGHPWAFTLSVAIVAFFIIFSLWASFAEIDEVTRGEGQVVPSQRIQEIQNLEGGILQEMRVREGDKVQKEQLLAIVTNDQSSGAQEEYTIRKEDQEASLIRLNAELEGTKPIFPAELQASNPGLVANQLQAYASNRQNAESEIRAMEAEVSQRNREVETAQARKQGLEEQLKFELSQAAQIRPLVERGIHPRLELLQLEQRIASTKGDINTTEQDIARAHAAVTGAEERLETQKTKQKAVIREEINKRSAELRSITAALANIATRRERTNLTSPVNGIVQKININTVGGTIKGGETIIEILPVDESLLIEARIKPSDRAFVFPGQKAIIKISAYDFSVYGGLDGNVEQISASTMEDKRGEVYYLVRLRTKTNTLFHRGKGHDIIPGMTATVDIVTGKRTVMAYLLKPIIKAQQTAMQER